MKTFGLARLWTLSVLPIVSCTADPPEVPSWERDVQPILRGSCSHCHGVTVKPPATPTTRYDICDASAFSARGLSAAPGAKASALITTVLRSSAGPLRMPPPPAAPLSDYEVTVLERWFRGGAPDCSKQGPNRKPSFRIVDPLKASAGGAAVTIEVSDPDNDQVLGKAKLGTAPESPANTYLIQGAGRWLVEFPGGRPNDPLMVTLFDGYDTGP